MLDFQILACPVHSQTLYPPSYPYLLSLIMELRPSWEAAVMQVLKNFPAFYGTRKFIIVFTKILNRSTSSARSIQSVSPNPISLKLSQYRVFKKELYNSERLYKFIQRECTVSWTVIMWQDTPSFTWDGYGSTSNVGCFKKRFTMVFQMLLCGECYENIYT
jgi:hypothetical protein